MTRDLIEQWVHNASARPDAISTAAYDTAWLAWLYPRCRNWLLAHQHPDGSWGARLEFFHDRVISTLAAVNALAATSTEAYALRQLERGIAYVEQALPRLAEDVSDTIGFELLLPALVRMGQDLGLRHERVGALIEPELPAYHRKMSLIPEALLYDPAHSMSFSLEFVGFNGLDVARAAGVYAPGGHVQSSPATTAFLEIAAKRGRGRAYLDRLVEQYDGAAPAFSSSRIFQTVWGIRHIDLVRPLPTLKGAIAPMLNHVSDCWNETGVGWAEHRPSDLDDTALAFWALTRAGIHKDPDVFRRYEQDEHFQTYPFERTVSIGVHLHVLDALKAAPRSFLPREAMIAKALGVVRRNVTNGYLIDKFQVSPYYTTSHAILALLGLDDGFAAELGRWLLRTQRDNGSFTFYPSEPTAATEETAYALLSLMELAERLGGVPGEALHRGAAFLQACDHADAGLPALWTSKVLYTPYNVVTSAIVAALAMYDGLRRSSSTPSTALFDTTQNENDQNA